MGGTGFLVTGFLGSPLSTEQVLLATRAGVADADIPKANPRPKEAQSCPRKLVLLKFSQQLYLDRACRPVNSPVPLHGDGRAPMTLTLCGGWSVSLDWTAVNRVKPANFLG